MFDSWKKRQVEKSSGHLNSNTIADFWILHLNKKESRDSTPAGIQKFSGSLNSYVFLDFHSLQEKTFRIFKWLQNHRFPDIPFKEEGAESNITITHRGMSRTPKSLILISSLLLKIILAFSLREPGLPFLNAHTCDSPE